MTINREEIRARCLFGCREYPAICDGADALVADVNSLLDELDEKDAVIVDQAAIITELRKIVNDERANYLTRCKDCRFLDTRLCRAAQSIEYDLRKEQHTFKTFMEPDGFCSIGERGAQEGESPCAP